MGGGNVSIVIDKQERVIMNRITIKSYNFGDAVCMRSPLSSCYPKLYGRIVGPTPESIKICGVNSKYFLATPGGSVMEAGNGWLTTPDDIEEKIKFFEDQARESIDSEDELYGGFISKSQAEAIAAIVAKKNENNATAVAGAKLQLQH